MTFTAAHAAPLAFDASSQADIDFAGGRGEPPPATVALRGTHEIVLALRHAGSRRVRIAWELQGAVDAPLLIVQGGISAHRHAAASARFAEPGWWAGQCGETRALDTARYRVLAIDWLGADGALDCCIDPADQADAIAAVLDTLAIARAHAYIGASYGAMVGLQFAARHPARLGRLIAISGAHRSHPQTTALRVIQRRIVALGRSEGTAREALALARALAVVGYRSAEEFDARFAALPAVDADSARFGVEDYFDAIGPRFVARFSPVAYTRLSESIDLQQVDPASITVPTDLVAVTQDQIVPCSDIDALALGIAAACRVHRIDSLYGHDAFLKEPVQIDRVLRAALRGDAA
ncbi:homoserine O-succinyltransferase MetX [Chiayiivirga flava]|uniref:Homoserine O-acetyltransferase n=1 Tax=Chiayiivirga flava TaxID=659595 RepID=A0A7W8D5K9_9GAMM|nr:homoserine O-succinyltransferase [Chiayiivirga flava]MBB5207137.1 homoserine O-acetyltransferase [Chiayiivirga flava]